MFVLHIDIKISLTAVKFGKTVLIVSTLNFHKISNLIQEGTGRISETSNKKRFQHSHRHITRFWCRQSSLSNTRYYYTSAVTLYLNDIVTWRGNKSSSIGNYANRKNRHTLGKINPIITDSVDVKNWWVSAFSIELFLYLIEW